MNFGQIHQALQNGDSLTTNDLKYFVREASKTINLFNRIPEYRLVAIDLINKRQMVEGYVQARREFRFDSYS